MYYGFKAENDKENDNVPTKMDYVLLIFATNIHVYKVSKVKHHPNILRHVFHMSLVLGHPAF